MRNSFCDESGQSSPDRVGMRSCGPRSRSSASAGVRPARRRPCVMPVRRRSGRMRRTGPRGTRGMAIPQPPGIRAPAHNGCRGRAGELSSVVHNRFADSVVCIQERRPGGAGTWERGHPLTVSWRFLHPVPSRGGARTERRSVGRAVRGARARHLHARLLALPCVRIPVVDGRQDRGHGRAGPVCAITAVGRTPQRGRRGGASPVPARPHATAGSLAVIRRASARTS